MKSTTLLTTAILSTAVLTAPTRLPYPLIISDASSFATQSPNGQIRIDSRPSSAYQDPNGKVHVSNLVARDMSTTLQRPNGQAYTTEEDTPDAAYQHANGQVHVNRIHPRNFHDGEGENGNAAVKQSPNGQIYVNDAKAAGSHTDYGAAPVKQTSNRQVRVGGPLIARALPPKVGLRPEEKVNGYRTQDGVFHFVFLDDEGKEHQIEYTADEIVGISIGKGPSGM